MKKWFLFLLCILGFSLFQSPGSPSAASCEGTKNCGNNKWVSCEVSIPSLGHCRIDHLPDGVKCIALNPNWEEVDSQTKRCTDSSGSCASCDPADPLYWVYCDVFAL